MVDAVAARGSTVPVTALPRRYAVRKVLKAGNGVETLLASDTRTGQDVVVKSVDPAYVPEAARLRFEHETRVLRHLSGVGLVGLHDAGATADRLYLVQPFVPGPTLDAALKQGSLSLPSALRVGIDLATALDAAHSAGVCHRDVKPANVVLDDDASVGRATLIDFGFARSPWLHESIRDDLVGTLRYLAPESAGVLASPADERSDLYALGVVLYECLAGQPPFTGGSVGELLRQHLSAPVPELREAGVPVPRAVDAVLQRLLRKDPAERYQSAAALVGDLTELLDALQAGETEPRLVVGRLDTRRSLTDPVFVGREAELEELRGVVQALGEGRGGLVLLEAESGGGKSRLLGEVAQLAARCDIEVLSGQAVAQAGQRPFGLLRGVADDLLELLERDDFAAAALVEQLADVAPAIVSALPQLRGLLGTGADDVGPEQFGEQRNLAALRRLVRAVGTPQRPVLLVLDDCHWADALTLRLLDGLFQDEDECCVAVLAAYRSEEVPAEHPLRRIHGARHLALGPLSPDAMALLAESMAGPLPAAALDTVVRLADGSPFMGAAVLRGLVETGALAGADDGWVVEERALGSVQTTRRAAGVLVRRLELLDPAVLALLSVGAVLGKQFDVSTAVRLAGTGAGAAQALEDARRRRLLWVDERTGRCSFFHDKVREALLDGLPAQERRDLHARAAEVLAAASGDAAREDAVFDLAYHFDAAGRAAEALPHALAGAALARGRHALDTAVLHYRMALRSLATVGADDDLRRQIAEGLGDVLTLQGSYDEAERCLFEARSLVRDRAAAAALDGKLGDLAFKRGEMATAREYLEGALAQLGRPVRSATVVLLVRLIWELLVQTAHSVAPRLLVGRRGATAPEEHVLAMRLHSRLAYVYWFGSGRVACAWSHLRGMNLAERYSPSPELGQAWSEHAPVMTMLPWFSRGRRYAARSLQVRRELGDVWGQGQSLGFTGVVAYAAADYAGAADACGEAVRLLERTGDQWEVNTARWHVAMCRHRTGDLAEAVALARRVHGEAAAIGDRTSAAVALSIEARASGGDVPRDLLQTELDRGGDDVHRTSELHLALALHERREGRLDAAAEQLRRGAAAVRRAGLRQEYVAVVPAWQATVLRELVEETSAHEPQLRRARLRAASRAVLRARWWALAYRNNVPHVLREAALVASLRGRTRRAERLLARSRDVAQEQGARYEAALSALALTELCELRGAPAQDVATARATVADLERGPDAVEPADPGQPSVSLSDRFSTLLDVGRKLTAATSEAAVESAVRDAALLLLRGERCHLVRVSALEAGLTTESGEGIDQISRTLLAKAVELGQPLAAGDISTDESESLLLSGVRSVLAAPVAVHGEPLFCFYVTHRLLGQLFGPEEVQLAAFIATLAGAAFEHLAGSEARFRSLAQNSSDVITLVDRDGVVEYQSEAAGRVFGNAASSVVGRRVQEWAHPDDVPRLADALRSARPGVEVRVECRLKHADGSYRFAETSVTNLLDVPHLGALVLNTRDITERRVLEDELRNRALHDALTGLPNRAVFLDRAKQALERARRRPTPLAVAFLDLDDFKAVNDSLGHSAGDELLVEMARRFVGCVRPSDTVARLGGDEFAVLLDEADLDTARDVVERMLTAAALPVTVSGEQVVVSLSVGLAELHDDVHEADQLLVEADTAMYAAKQRGKHCYDTFVPAMRSAMERRSRLRTELERAVAGEQFRLHYQPIVAVATGARVGVEALIRWEHPEQGLLSPSDFISFAEDSGQIVRMGSWVLRTACLATTQIGPAARMSVNVSGRQLRSPELVADVESALLLSGLQPGRLILEITETATVGEGEAQTRETVAMLNALKAMGVQIALDDFGTGFSPLSHLRRFPVDLLKIDRSFVAGINTSAQDEAIVRGIIDLAHALGVRVVAEGVEQLDQLAALTALGCDMAQGYLWMRPSPLGDLAQLAAPSPRSSSEELAAPSAFDD